MSQFVNDLLRMSPTRPGKKEVRVILDEETVRLLKKLAGVTERSMSSLVQESVDQYLESDNTRELIQRYNLED
jgi:Ribbon-helix-helix protein, copG family